MSKRGPGGAGQQKPPTFFTAIGKPFEPWAECLRHLVSVSSVAAAIRLEALKKASGHTSEYDNFPRMVGRGRKYLLYALAAVALVTVSSIAISKIRDAIQAAHSEQMVATALEKGNLTPTGDSSRDADAARVFVNRNSIHKIDAEFFAHWGDNAEILRRLIARQERHGAPPHLECSSRSAVMRLLLEGMGYKTRSIVVYASADGTVSHTFLEVLNPATSRWEAQDPDYDVYWSVGGRRADIADLVRGEAVPCSGSQCGWGLRSSEGLAVAVTRPYLSLASVRDAARPLLVNRRRSDDLGVFCKAVEKDCRGNIIELH